MGYNTVAILLNDNMHVGAKDPEIGVRIQSASQNWYRKNRGADLDISARAIFENGSTCSASYGSIISQDHASSHQIVIVHGNMGWRIDQTDYDKYLSRQALENMKDCLERNGYRVVKKRKAKLVKISTENAK